MANVESFDDVLRVEREGAVATLTLTRPDSMNALSKVLRGALIRAFGELQADEEVRVAILTGEGRAFCAGLDLKELSGMGAAEATEADDGVGLDIGLDVPAALATFEGPIIGAVNGHAITGGFELALSCDVLIASTKARFADTHARVGILPGWGLSQKLPRMIDQALAWGLVNRVVEPEELLPACHALANDMVSCVPEILRGYKRLIDEGTRMPLGAALEWEAKESLASARAIRPEDVAKRREGVVQRGRDSKK